MKKINYKNPYLIGGIILVLSITGYLVYNKWKKKKLIDELVKTGAVSVSNTSSSGSTSTTSTGGILITNHDATWDYLYEGGRWYTRKKGSTSWIDMKDSLSTDNYNIAVSRLQKYI
jgi:hypothetical protein